jgi:hypothetical protein
MHENGWRKAIHETPSMVPIRQLDLLHPRDNVDVADENDLAGIDDGVLPCSSHGSCGMLAAA